MIAENIQAAYGRTKWSLILRGLLGIAVAVLVFARPLGSVAALALVVAVWAIFDGMTNIARAFALRDVTSSWWMFLVAGLIGLVFGGAALYYYPALSLAFIVAWTALWLILAGATAAYVAVREKQLGLTWGWTMAFGVTSIVAGVLAYMYPQVTLGSLLGIIAAFGLISGITMLLGAMKLGEIERKVRGAVEAREREATGETERRGSRAA